MTDSLARILLPLGLALGGMLVFYRVISGSASSNAYMYLAALIGLEILLVATWKYRERVFPVLVIVFLGAGMIIPFHGAFTMARWGVLGVAAIAGFALYMKDSHPTFGAFHLIALFSIITASISALVSNYPKIAIMKALSLLLVFLYGASGARLAIVGREAKFLAGLLVGCEIFIYASAFSYFVLRWPLYGNPNSLGILMGVVAYPLLLWGVIVSEGTRSYKRNVAALLVTLLLLFSSYARAAIGAALLTSLFLCIPLRRYRLLMKGAVLALLGATLMMVLKPLAEAHSEGGFLERLSDTFVYKGKREQGLLGSRESPWQKTSAVIREHPWFGSGFGTSVTSLEGHQQDVAFQSASVATREHGTSYLAIVEWTGLLGVVPFYSLVLLILLNVGRVGLWMQRTRDPFSPAVPIAAVLAGALFHAAFEDWMFAVGYHMCVFFWAFAFMLVDILPDANRAPIPATVPALHLSLTPDQRSNVAAAGFR